MIKDKIIDEVVCRLVDVYHPVEIYLFGSYAWGKPTEESDLDLLVVIENSEKKHLKFFHTLFAKRIYFNIKYVSMHIS